MTRTMRRVLALGLAMAIAPWAGLSGAATGALKVTSDKAATGFKFPESVGCDPAGRFLYVSNFGGTELKPAEKDGLGFVSKVALDGKVIEERFLPAHGETMNKPKGIWIAANRLWVTDIDAVWIFDLGTRKSRRLELPGVKFANDPAVRGNVLYVSDNRNDQLIKVEPADFLDAKVQPKIAVVLSGQSIQPNGLWPGKGGELFMVGFVAPDRPRAIFVLDRDDVARPISTPIGRLDGVYQLKDGSLLATDWNTGSLFHWTREDGAIQPLARDFKGPADFCVMPKANGYTAYVPDLVKSEIRILQIEQ